MFYVGPTCGCLLAPTRPTHPPAGCGTFKSILLAKAFPNVCQGCQSGGPSLRGVLKLELLHHRVNKKNHGCGVTVTNGALVAQGGASEVRSC